MQHQLIVATELPSFPLSALPTTWMVRNEVQNFKPDAFQFNYNVQQWYLAK